VAELDAAEQPCTAGNDGLCRQTSPSPSAMRAAANAKRRPAPEGRWVSNSAKTAHHDGEESRIQGKGRDAAGEERSAIKAMARRPPVLNIELPHAVLRPDRSFGEG